MKESTIKHKRKNKNESLFEMINKKIESEQVQRARYKKSLFQALLLCFLAIILTILPSKLSSSSTNDFILAIVSAGILVIFGLSLMRYLQKDENSFTSGYFRTSKYTNEDSNTLKLSKRDKEEIISLLKNEYVDTTANGIIWSIYKKVEEELSKFSEVNVVTSIFNDIRKRLLDEVFSLQKRGNLNLVLGILITVLGIVLLWRYILPVSPISFSDSQFIQFFLPRLSLVILIEIFAYFFLRLYKSNLNEIKYFQNELTNVESRLAALQLAFLEKDPKAKQTVITQLIKTERNPVFAKDKESNKDQDSLIELIKTISSIIKENKSQ